MALWKGDSPSRYILLLPLPSLYILLVVFTMIQSTKVDGGTYYRILGVNPILFVVGMVSDGTLFYAFLLVFGTFWWSCIGFIGRKSWDGNASRISGALGVFVAVCTGAIGILMTKDVFYQDQDAGTLSLGAIFQYAGVGMLCLGAIVVAIYAAKTALGHKKPA